MLWNISYDGGGNLNDKFNAITLDSNNDIIVTGQTFTTAINANYVTVKYGNSTTGINESSFISNITIYPNPTNTSATILFNLLKVENISISIVDMLGREIKNTTTNNLQSGNNKINLDISDLNNGIYFVRINNKKGFVNKLVIEK